MKKFTSSLSGVMAGVKQGSLQIWTRSKTKTPNHHSERVYLSNSFLITV